MSKYLIFYVKKLTCIHKERKDKNINILSNMYAKYIRLKNRFFFLVLKLALLCSKIVVFPQPGSYLTADVQWGVGTAWSTDLVFIRLNYKYVDRCPGHETKTTDSELIPPQTHKSMNTKINWHIVSHPYAGRRDPPPHTHFT